MITPPRPPHIWVVMFSDYGYSLIAWFADELEARRWADTHYIDGKIGRWEQGEEWPPPTDYDRWKAEQEDSG